MSKPRPTAFDRELADVFKRMEPGEHLVTVTDTSARLLSFMGLAELKTEGGCNFSIGDKRYNVVPREEKTK